MPLVPLRWGLLILSYGASVFAQDFGYVDANALPASPTPGTFVSLAPTVPLAERAVSVGVRNSYLLKPIGGTQPAPSATGTTTTTVEHLWLAEALLGVGVLPGLDAGVAVPLHLYQSGLGLSPIGVGTELAHFAIGDPRITLGYALPIPHELRCYATVYLPLGSAENFAGERLVRADLGVATGWHWPRFDLELDVSARLREVSTIALTLWGPQARVSVAGAVRLTDAFSLGAELTLAPTLVAQPPAGDGTAGYLLPAEALLSANQRIGTWSLGALLGTGVPLSVPSSESASGGLRRGPTSPVVRFGLEMRKAF